MFEISKRWGKNWELGRKCEKCALTQYRYSPKGSETVADPADPFNEKKWTRRPIIAELWCNLK